LYTLFHEPGSVSSSIEDRPIFTSALNRLPALRRRYRQLLPLFPLAVESFDMRDYDLVVSTSHCAIKSLRIAAGAQHLSYVHTPMRYIYEQFDDYFGPGKAAPAVRLAMRTLRPALRAWDRATSGRPTALIANSHHVQRRIQRHWGRDAQVIHPPVDLSRFFAPSTTRARDYYLLFGALAPYKRADLAIEAFNRLKLPLVVAGGGPELERYRALAGSQIKVLGRVADAEVPALYQGARALIFPGEEDFGITPLEAQACATPVIAFGQGGALETVRPLGERQATGLFFEKQTVDSLIDAVLLFERQRKLFFPDDLVKQAEYFSTERFDRVLGEVLDEVEDLASVSARRRR